MNKQKSEDRRQKSEENQLWTRGKRIMDDLMFVPRSSIHFKSLKIVQTSVVCLLLSVFSLLTGCRNGGEDFYRVQIAPEKLRQVETLDLQKAEDKQADRVDMNEPAPAELELTLEQCRALTLENNLDLKVQLINPAIAAERVSQQEAQFEAAFSASVSHTRTDTPLASTLDISGSNVNYTRTDLGVSVPLRTGGTISFDAIENRTKTDSMYSIFNPSYSSDFSASISQPLLRNAGRRSNTYAIRIAEYDRQITDARTKLELIRIIAAVDRVYWRLYTARRELDVRKQQYELAKALFEQAQRFVSAGEMAQIEVFRTEAGVAQRLEAIILAENNVRDRERELKQTLNKSGLGMETTTILVPATEPDPVRYELEKQRLVEIAIEQRMEMLELELQIAQDVDTLDYMQNQTLPLVTMDYTYNVNGLGSTRDNSYDLLFDKRFEDHRLGLQLLVPLGNESAKSQLRQAFYQRRQRLASRDSRKAMIEYEVLNAIDQLEANWQRILAGRQSTLLENRLFEAEKRQFELDLVTSTDVLQAQTNFADAQSAEILALSEYQIALVDMAYATGTLLGAAKVQWEPVVSQE
jgi:outer membrane protein